MCFACIESGRVQSEADESCTRSDDCLAPLRCVEQVCTPRVDPPEPDQGLDAFSENDAVIVDFTVPDFAVDQAPRVLPWATVTGHAMLALAAGVDPSHPLLFEAEVAVQDVDGQPILALSLTALTADGERQPVGESFEAQAPLNPEDGSFRADFGRIVIPGAADTIVPEAPIEADLVLTGLTLGQQICGTVEGQIYQPASLQLDGSFGTVPVGQDFTQVSPVTRCLD